MFLSMFLSMFLPFISELVLYIVVDLEFANLSSP